MNHTQSILVRRLVRHIERSCWESLGRSTLTSADTAELMVKTLQRWNPAQWTEASVVIGGRQADFSLRVISAVVATFQARARVLRLSNARYRVTYFKQGMQTKTFENPLQACEFASEVALDGESPAPVDVIEPLQLTPA